MSRVLLCSNSIELADRLAVVAAASLPPFQLAVVPAAGVPHDPSALWQGDPAGPPQVLLLDCTAVGVPATLDLTARLGEQCPAVSVVLVSNQGPELALPALRAGAVDILPPAAHSDEMDRVLQRATELAQVRTAPPAGAPPVVPAEPATGRVISVVSPKGGVGKTTVATNLAVGLARSAPQATVLVDLDIQFGDVASGLSLNPEYFLPSAVSGQASRDAMVLKTFLTLHQTGLYVLCAPESPAEAEGISAENVRQLLRTLAHEFRYVVVDTAPGLTDHTLAAMDVTTDLVLLTSMDVPGLRGLRKEIDTLRELKLMDRKPQVVINFADTSAGLSAADVEATVGAPVDLMLPRSKSVTTSVNLGVPLLQSGARDALTKPLRSLVDRFALDKTPTRPTAPVRRLHAKEAAAVPRRAASGWFRRPRVMAS